MLKPSRIVRMEKTAGVDIGASKIDWAVLGRGGVEASGKEEAKKTFSNSDLRAVVSGIIKNSGAKAAGISVAGFVCGGKVAAMPNLPKIKNLEFGHEVEISVQNDVKCAALAIWWRRGAKKGDSFAVVAAGSGIGGAVVDGGRLVCGARNAAGEFGHIKIPLGNAGRKASLSEWEGLCGGRGVEAEFSRIIDGHASISRKKYREKSAKWIFASDSPLARRVCSNAAFYFGLGLANIANSLNPEEIVLCGSVSKAYLGKYAKLVQSSFRAAVIGPAEKAKISKSGFENPSLVGSILLARHKSNKRIAEFLGEGA